MQTLIQRHVPARTRSVLRRIYRTLYYLPSDALDTLLGRRDPLVPPRWKNFVGGDYEEIAEVLFRQFVEFGGIEPDYAILDVGCGMGRAAGPLTSFLTGEGQYYGIDIVKEGIDWCNANIATRFPNFHFELADIYNRLYNPGGTLQASGYRFPYPDETFDFVILASVFTHMLPTDVRHYASEITRVLKPGRRCFTTFFLLNPESTELLRSGLSQLDFRYADGPIRQVSEVDPEKAVAYQESFVREIYREFGLEIIEPVHYGMWCGRQTDVTFQDIVIAAKAGCPPREDQRGPDGATQGPSGALWG